MTISLILLAGFCLALSGRFVFGRWFNHVSIYAGIWSVALALFEARLIDYYRLDSGTWIVIIVGSLAFAFGAFAVATFDYAFRDRLPLRSDLLSRRPEETRAEERALRTALWILNIVTLLAGLQHWWVVLRKFGSVSNVLLYGNLVYSMRLADQLPGMIPYFDALGMTAAVVGGAYISLAGRFKFAGFLPLILIIFIELANMGRARIIIGAILFAASYLLGKRGAAPGAEQVRESRWKRIAPIGVVIVILALGLETIRSLRGANESISDATTQLRSLEGASFVTPMVYMYFTVEFGVLNQYLKQGGERILPGGNTFAPVFRLLDKFGLKTYVPYYQQFYNTPVGANTGSYLRELHADFGLLGILLGPFIFGLLSSIAWFRYRASKQFRDLTILAYMFSVVGMSIFYVVTRGGDFIISFVCALGVGLFVDRMASLSRRTLPISPANISGNLST